MKTLTTATTAALGLAALMLTGCSIGMPPTPGDPSGGGAESGTTVWDFPLNGVEPSDDVTIVVPDDLREALGSQADDILVDSVHVTPHEIDGLDHCAADLAIAYGDGGLEAITAVEDEDDVAEDAAASAEDALTDALGVDSLDEVAAILDEIIGENGPSAAGALADLPGDASLLAEMYDEGDTGVDLIEEFIEHAEETASESNEDEAATSEAERLTDALDISGFSESDHVFAAGDLDDADAEPGIYVSDDLATLTVVGDCADSVSDEHQDVELRIPEIGDSGDIESFAFVQYTLMADGTIGVSGEVDDYSRDANGDWTSD